MRGRNRRWSSCSNFSGKIYRAIIFHEGLESLWWSKLTIINMVHILCSKLKRKLRDFGRTAPKNGWNRQINKLTSDFAVLILEILSDQVCLRNNGFFQMFDFCWKNGKKIKIFSFKSLLSSSNFWILDFSRFFELFKNLK